MTICEFYFEKKLSNSDFKKNQKGKRNIRGKVPTCLNKFHKCQTNKA